MNLYSKGLLNLIKKNNKIEESENLMQSISMS
jgi:hypothetical protein